MSRRPSSNTANRPTGPAPTIATSVEIASLMDYPCFAGVVTTRPSNSSLTLI